VGWAGYVAHTGKEKNVYKIVVGKPVRKNPLTRPSCGWVDINKMYLRETGDRVYIGLVCLRIGTSEWLLNLRFS
jgi:hypothetical protein